MDPRDRHPYFADYTPARLAGILAMARERASAQPEGSPEHAAARRAEAWVLAEQAHRDGVTAEGTEAECGYCGWRITLRLGEWMDDDFGSACMDTSAPFVPHKPKEG